MPESIGARVADSEAAEQATRLLDDADHGGARGPESTGIADAAAAADDNDDNDKDARAGNGIVNLLCLIIFISSSAFGFATIPFTRILEDIVCREHLGDIIMSLGGQIDERLCKDKAIQSEVATVFAVTSMLDAVVCFAAALPWGLAADRIGRKPVFAISLGGIFCTILIHMVVLSFDGAVPVRLVWAAGLTPVMGGGIAVLNAMVLSMVTDATPEATRSMAFLRVNVAYLGGNLVSPALSSLVMQAAGPWVCPFIALGLLVFGAVAFSLVPETRHAKAAIMTLQEEEDYDDESNEIRGGGNIGNRAGQTRAGRDPKSPSFARTAVAQLRDAVAVIRSPSLALLLLTKLGSAAVSFSTLQFMAQFLSKRYAMRLADTGYVQSAYGLAQGLQAVVVLPRLCRVLASSASSSSSSGSGSASHSDSEGEGLGGRAQDDTKKDAPDNHHRRDLGLAKGSYALMIAGAAVLGLAPALPAFLAGLVLMALGSGHGSFVKTLMSLHVDAAHRSRLFSLIGMVEVLGHVYAQPMLAGLFSLGMNLGGAWIGLPYFGLALLLVLCYVLLTLVRPPRHHNGLALD